MAILERWRSVEPEVLGRGTREYVFRDDMLVWIFSRELGGTATNGRRVANSDSFLEIIEGMAGNIGGRLDLVTDVCTQLLGPMDPSVLQLTFDAFSRSMPVLERVVRRQIGIVPHADWTTPFWFAVNSHTQAPWPIEFHHDSATAWASMGTAPAVAAEIDAVVAELFSRTTPVATSQRMALEEILRAEPGLRIEGAARRLGVSTRTLQRVLAPSSETFAQLRARVRLENALALLERSDAKIADIADTIGFTSPSHFTAWFRRMRGVTPSRFRERP